MQVLKPSRKIRYTRPQESVPRRLLDFSETTLWFHHQNVRLMLTVMHVTLNYAEKQDWRSASEARASWNRQPTDSRHPLRRRRDLRGLIMTTAPHQQGQTEHIRICRMPKMWTLGAGSPGDRGWGRSPLWRWPRERMTGSRRRCRYRLIIRVLGGAGGVLDQNFTRMVRSCPGDSVPEARWSPGILGLRRLHSARYPGRDR